MNTYNLLLVLNQNLSIDDLLKLDLDQYKSILILSTHSYFMSEKSLIFNSTSCKIDFKLFSDFATDSELESCDQKANKLAKKKLLYTMPFYINTNLTFKNELVCRNLLSDNSFDSLILIDGLGIKVDVWKKYFPKYEILESSYPKAKGTKLNSLELNLIEYNGNQLYFIGNVKRLKLKSDVSIINTEKIGLVPLLVKMLFSSFPFSTSIHNYRFYYSYFKNKLIVFIDGLHPSNYPEAYLPYYRKNTIFITRDNYDKKWFTKYGYKVSKNPDICKKEIFNTPTKLNKIKNVLLMLNHAGDWTSLINRSDTDILIDAFTKLASKYNKINFTIRAHPTMNFEEHEGINSFNRIKSYIKNLDINNLKVSNYSLYDDIKLNQLIITEYSNAWLDAVKTGKLGLILNLTKRRSFMKDYEELGFPSFNNFQAFDNYFSSILSNPDDLINKQNKAVDLYNKLQND